MLDKLHTLTESWQTLFANSVTYLVHVVLRLHDWREYLNFWISDALCPPQWQEKATSQKTSPDPKLTTWDVRAAWSGRELKRVPAELQETDDYQLMYQRFFFFQSWLCIFNPAFLWMALIALLQLFNWFYAWRECVAWSSWPSPHEGIKSSSNWLLIWGFISVRFTGLLWGITGRMKGTY